MSQRRLMANFSVIENTTIELNEASKSSIPTGTAILLSTLNILLSITASLGNALILVALHKETSLHLPAKHLLRCLAITDLCTGIITQPPYAIIIFSSVTIGMSRDVLYYMNKLYLGSGFVLSQVSIFTSAAISVDRLQALLSGLRYRQVVTLPRVRAAANCFWLVGISVESLTFWSVSIAITVGCSLSLFSVITAAVCYSTIYVKLRQRQLQMTPQGQPDGRELPLNIARYKKTVSTAKWVQVALLACYIPLIAVTLLITYSLIPESLIGIARHISVTFVYVNSSINPFLYCWKIRSVRQAAKEMIKQLNCCCKSA